MGARVTVYNRRAIGGEPAGDLEIRAAELVGDGRPGTRCRSRSTSCRSSRSPPRARTATSRLRGAEELRAKESDRIEATVDALRAIGQHVRATEDGFVIRGVPARPRGGSSRGAGRSPDRDARRRRRRSPRRTGSRSTTPTASPSASRASSRCSTRCRTSSWGARRHDRRDRRACGRREELGCTRARGAARVPLPGHGGHVPRPHLARAASRRRRSTTARTRGPGSRRSGRVRSTRRRRDRRRTTSPPRSASRRSTPSVPIVAAHHEVREVMRERQRALAREGDSVIEGRDIGVVVGAARRVKVWLYADPAGRGRRGAMPSATGSTPRTLADELRRRDARDADNTHRADDAVEVDTTLSASTRSSTGSRPSCWSGSREHDGGQGLGRRASRRSAPSSSCRPASRSTATNASRRPAGS